jgi:hypothetical protein
MARVWIVSSRRAAIGLVDFRFEGITHAVLRAGKPDQENRPPFARLFDGYRAVMVVKNLADDGEAEARAIRLP